MTTVKYIGLIVCLGMILGCAKESTEEAPTPIVRGVAETETPAEKPDANDEELVAAKSDTVMEAIQEEPGEEFPDLILSDTLMVQQEAPAAVEEVQDEEPSPAVILQAEHRDVEYETEEAINTDSTAYGYMIRPNDYLSKIAYDQYGNANEWRTIYKWNREEIGNDPNLIYPYHELSLYKPSDVVDTMDLSYEYFVHEVKKGETLWSIAGMEYGAKRAWIVIFWDNEKVLEANSGVLEIGMELKIRTRLLF